MNNNVNYYMDYQTGRIYVAPKTQIQCTRAK